MRLFVAKDAGSIIREKQVFAGDDTSADSLIASFLSSHPGWTAQEVDQATFDASIVVLDNTPIRAQALAQFLTSTAPSDKLLRAVLLVILDEVNVIRALPALAQTPRTVNQFKSAVQTKLNSGAAD